MDEAQKKESLSENERQKLLSFFEVLIQIDRRKRITPTAQAQHKKESAHGA